MGTRFFIGFIFSAFLALATPVSAQVVRKPLPNPTPIPSPTPLPPTLDQILDQAELQSRNYRESFKYLSSDETKTFTTFDKKGEAKKNRVIVSNFIVYPLSREEGRIVEYRNVLTVDGKSVDKDNTRAQDFFDRIAKAESSSKELSEIEKESLRYDDNLLINGLTLFQAQPLAANLRPFFDFKVEGKTTVDGAEVYVISYQQTRPSPDITLNSDADTPGDRARIAFDINIDNEKGMNERVRGRLMIDAATFRLRGEEREMTIQPDGFGNPTVVIREDFAYADSEFDMLVPRRISHTHYRAKTKDRTAAKEVMVTFDYSRFTKPDVTVKSAEVK